MGKSNKMVFKKAREAISGPRSQKSSTANTTSASKLPTSFKIVAGSYEKLLYGLEGNITASARSDYSFDLRPIFIFPAHVSCIKTVAASPTGGKWLATGSADEIVKVWDLRRKKEIGGLMHHEGSVYVFHPLDISITGRLVYYRIHHTFIIPIPFTPAFRVRGWDSLSLPCT